MTVPISLIFGFLVTTQEPSPEMIRTAIARALPPLTRAATVHSEKRTCFACHNQAYPMLTWKAASLIGLKPDADWKTEQVHHIRGFIAEHRKDWAEGRGTGGQVDTAGWLLATLEAADEAPDQDTAMIVDYLLKRDASRSHWRTSSQRPPTQASVFTTNYLAIRALKHWGTPEQNAAISKRMESVRDWAITTSPKETEDHVYRLRILSLTESSEKSRNGAIGNLLKLQRADGGWGQRISDTSDAYATATALTALANESRKHVRTAAYQRGISFLIRAQKSDGTWHVATRARPIQTYFEAGYPHGKDQFISSSAASWAVMALVDVLDASVSQSW